jgi:hypothetical protein
MYTDKVEGEPDTAMRHPNGTCLSKKGLIKGDGVMLAGCLAGGQTHWRFCKEGSLLLAVTDHEPAIVETWAVFCQPASDFGLVAWVQEVGDVAVVGRHVFVLLPCRRKFFSTWLPGRIRTVFLQ